MDGYEIPDIFLPGFEALLKLDAEDFKKVVNFLSAMPIGMGSKTFHATLSEKLKNRDISDLSPTLYSLGGLLILDVKDLNQLIEDLSISFKEQSDLKLTSSMLNKFKLRLKILFANSENLKLTLKTYSLCYENDRIYKDSRIVTDIRLVFNDDLKNSDRNAVVIHQLKIETLQNDERNYVFFALDADDLLKFREQIDRAIEKEKLIKDSYGKSVNFIDLKE
jgi:hypothetical protein